MFKPISIFPALALVALALFVAGCGGGDDDTTASTGADSTLASDGASPTKAEFIKTAEKVCSKERRERFFEAVKYRKVHRQELAALEPIPAEEKIVLDVVLPAIEEEVKELDALPVPEGEEKKIEAIITGIEEGVKAAEKKPSRAWLEVPSEYAFRNVGLLIRAYGLVDCRNVA